MRRQRDAVALGGADVPPPVKRTKEEREADERAASLAKVAGEMAGWKPAYSALSEVRAVQTILPWLNVVSGVGGWPTDRFAMLHGPSNQGKTLLLLALLVSFLRRGHFAALLDAEHTTPFSWVEQMMGSASRLPTFLAQREASYEKVRNAVRRFCDKIGEARAKREIPQETTGLIALDSIRKLVPEKIWDELAKESAGKVKKGFRGKPAKRGVDGMGGRAAQIKAALNAAWLDELVPLLAQTGVGMVVIARETVEETAFSTEVSTGGGKALFFDSSLVVRSTLHRSIVDGEGKDAPLVGERHAVEVYKTKIAGKETRWPTAYFNVSNGKLDGVPAGFDLARDLLELAESRGAVRKDGSGQFFLERLKLGQGANKVVRRLYAEPELLARLERAVTGEV